jgi:hypothetical protein
MKKLLKITAAAMFSVSLLLLAGCGSVSANAEYGADGQSAYEFWKMYYEDGDLNGDGKIDEHDYLLYMKGTEAITPTVTIENGYWVINGLPTGVLATGINGRDGTTGGATKIMIVIDGTESYLWVDYNDDGKQGNNELFPLNDSFLYSKVLFDIGAAKDELNGEIALLDRQLFSQHDLFVAFINTLEPGMNMSTIESYKAQHTDGTDYTDIWLNGETVFAAERDACYALMEYNYALIEENLFGG